MLHTAQIQALATLQAECERIAGPGWINYYAETKELKEQLAEARRNTDNAIKALEFANNMIGTIRAERDALQAEVERLRADNEAMLATQATTRPEGGSP